MKTEQMCEQAKHDIQRKETSEGKTDETKPKGKETRLNKK